MFQMLVHERLDSNTSPLAEKNRVHSEDSDDESDHEATMVHPMQPGGGVAGAPPRTKLQPHGVGSRQCPRTSGPSPPIVSGACAPNPAPKNGNVPRPTGAQGASNGHPANCCMVEKQPHPQVGPASEGPPGDKFTSAFQLLAHERIDGAVRPLPEQSRLHGEDSDGDSDEQTSEGNIGTPREHVNGPEGKCVVQ